MCDIGIQYNDIYIYIYIYMIYIYISKRSARQRRALGPRAPTLGPKGPRGTPQYDIYNIYIYIYKYI